MLNNSIIGLKTFKVFERFNGFQQYLFPVLDSQLQRDNLM